MLSMSRDEFWSLIDACRRQSADIQTFNRVLEAMLDGWDLPRLAAFHKVMWHDIGVYNEDEVWEVLSDAGNVAHPS
jgi:hypothetical protein